MTLPKNANVALPQSVREARLMTFECRKTLAVENAGEGLRHVARLWGRLARISFRDLQAIGI